MLHQITRKIGYGFHQFVAFIQEENLKKEALLTVGFVLFVLFVIYS
jgi:hypothetical protein